MPEFLIILNSIGIVIAIGAAIGGIFFYLSRQVSRINEKDTEIADLKKEIAVLSQQWEVERRRLSKTNQHVSILADWVNTLRMEDEVTRTETALGQPFVPVKFEEDNS